MENQPRNWIISGATGFIGRELVRRLLLGGKDRLMLLVRERGHHSAEARVADLLDTLGIHQPALRDRVMTLAGDAARPGLGLAVHTRQRVIAEPAVVVHLAASTCLTNQLEAARNGNVEGTRRMLALARELQANGNLNTFAHVSTAFVAAARTDLVGADELDLDANFRNAYERSQAEAEQLVRTAMPALPVVIFRPSIVVGDSITGDAIGGNTIYWAVKQYLRGRSTFFARADATLDIVPVDYVADAMLALLRNPAHRGKCFPLVAGPGGQIQLGDFAARIAAHCGRPAPRILAPQLLHALTSPLAAPLLRTLLRAPQQRRFLAHMLAYLPYFSANPAFDDSPTAAALAPAGIRVPPLPDYLPTLLQYCLRQGWARTGARRTAALAGARAGLLRAAARWPRGLRLSGSRPAL